jgi:hypothetical protein
MFITKTPLNYSPAGNPVVFGFLSSTTDLRVYTVDLLDNNTNATIFTGKAYPTPNNPDFAYINLSNQLSSVVKQDVDNNNTLLIGKTEPIIKYKVFAQDFGIDVATGQLYAISAGITSGTYNAYESKLNTLYYSKKLTNNSFLMYSGDNATQRFLTFKPNPIKVNQYSSEQLYFIKSGQTSMKVSYAYTTSTGETLVQYTVPLTGGTIAGAVRATALPGGMAFPASPSTQVVKVTVDDPVYGLITLYNGTLPGTITTHTQWTTAVATAINTNTYGYTAAYVANTVVSITAPLAYGSLINGRDALILYVGASGYQSSFSGGIGGVTYFDMYRFQVSPKKLQLSGSTIPVGTTYSVYLADGSGVKISETRQYIVEDVDCNLDYVNLFFTNQVGGIDTIQMINPRLNYGNTKSIIKRTSLDVTATDVYVTNGIYNPEKQIYANTLNSTVALYTKPLNDIESEWLIELINSQNVWIELSNGELLPVVLTTNDYQLKKQKYTRNELIQYEIVMELPGNFYNIYDNDISIIIN